MNEPILHGIFPTPILIANIGREFTDKEKKFIDLQKKSTIKNEGNITSVDNYVMMNKQMEKLHKDLLILINYYIDKIIIPSEDVTPYITQSWLNWTEKNQYHHKHSHPNSFLSGVLYISAEENKDKITFFNDEYEQIKLYPKEWNLYNSNSWFFNIKQGDIIIFPSSLSHMVQQTEGDDTRISLSFNTFLKGKIGIASKLTELLNP